VSPFKFDRLEDDAAGERVWIRRDPQLGILDDCARSGRFKVLAQMLGARYIQRPLQQFDGDHPLGVVLPGMRLNLSNQALDE